jgi:hypothetical protein
MAKAKRRKSGTRGEHWGKEPDEQDYPAAADYLSLLLPETAARATVKRLEGAPLVTRKAKDLLRASRLALLPENNPHVKGDLRKVAQGKPLSPVLLVRGALATDVALTVADGYHRICASYHLDENADIPCRLVDLAPGTAPRRAASAQRSVQQPSRQ